MKKICIIGQGYIGIPTAFILAEKNFDIIGVDKDKKKISLLSQGILPFHEKEFSIFSKKIFEKGNYKTSEKVVSADVFIICVPTPFTKEKKCDFKYIISALEDIVPVLSKGNLVILESTVPPKTCEEIVIPLLEKSGLKAKEDFSVSHAPERILPGNILNEIINNDRIIGGIDEKSTQLTYEIYKSFCKGKILLTDATTAEMSKVTENAFRDVNIAFANELALICESLKINTYDIIEMANHHPRVNILSPGPGVGGHCIPIDPWFIVEKAPDLSKLIRQARIVNDEMPKVIARKIQKIVKKIKNPIVTIIGVAYKANVDDSRESPSYFIAQHLFNSSISVNFYDPLVNSFKFELSSLENAFKQSDCIVYAVNHSLFNDLDPNHIGLMMRNKNLLFCGNFGNPKKWEKSGFKIQVFGI